MRFGDRSSDDFGVVVAAQQGAFLLSMDEDSVSIPGRDGQVWYRSVQQPREFTVSLVVKARDRDGLRELWDQVTEWLDSGPARLIFDELPDRYWVARLSKGLNAKSAGISYVTQEEVGFIADDPHPYAVVDDTVTVTAPGGFEGRRHFGNAPSYPTITVAAVLSAGQVLTVTLDGKAVSVAGPLSASERLVVDCKDMRFLVTDAAGQTLRLATAQINGLADLVSDLPTVPPRRAWNGDVTLSGGSLSWLRVDCNSRWR